MSLVKEGSLSRKSLDEDCRLCKDVDAEDALHVALTLELDGLLWTGDKKLRNGLLAQGFDRFSLRLTD